MPRVTDLSPELSSSALILMRDMMCVVASEHVLITADVNTEKRALDALVNAS
ncbi:MAG: hypothetical protein HOI01_09415, partial [Proteobacteria bacterium]|nr:hypothetical protein [Pseudomonadota bacterium]